MNHRLVHLLRRRDPRAVGAEEHRPSVGLAVPGPADVGGLAPALPLRNLLQLAACGKTLSRLLGERLCCQPRFLQRTHADRDLSSRCCLMGQQNAGPRKTSANVGFEPVSRQNARRKQKAPLVWCAARLSRSIGGGNL